MIQKTFRLKGALTSLTPIHIVPPGAPEQIVAGEKVKMVSHEVIWHNGERIEVPCIPASTLRGALRRAATDLAYGFGESDSKPRLSDYLYNAVGGVKKVEKEDLGHVDRRAVRRAANPVVALYGAATPWDRSRALISSAYADPAIYEASLPKAERIGGRRSDDMIARDGLASLLSGDALSDWEGMRGAAKEDRSIQQKIDKLIKDKRGASPEVRASINAEIEELKNQKSGGNSLLRPLHHTVMPRGVVLTQDITLKDVTAAEAGLFFASISHLWAEAPEFGGKIAHGYGLVSASWEITEKTGGEWVPRGTLAAKPYTGLEDASPVSELISAWNSYRDSGEMNLALNVA